MGLRAGSARVDITPPLGTELAGYFNVRRATGVLDRIHGRALVLEFDGERIAIVSADLCMLSEGQVAEVRSRASRGTGIPEGNIMVTSTHIHTGPVTMGLLSGSVNSDYLENLIESLAEVVVLANERLVDAEVACGRGSLPELVFNRRYVMKDGSVRTNPGRGNPDILKAAGPTDPGVLAVHIKALSGKTLAILVNYANHVDVVGGTMISADFPGVMAREIEAVIGEGTETLYLMGTSGNINHIDVGRAARSELRREVLATDPDAAIASLKGYDEAKRIGRMLAGEVLKTLGNAKPIPVSRLVVRKKSVEIKRRAASSEELARARELLGIHQGMKASELLGIDFTNDPLLVEKVYAREILLLDEDERKSDTLEFQVLAFGDVAFSGIPAEAFVEIGLAIKQGSPFPFTGVVTLANGAAGYIPMPWSFNEGGYEPRLARSSRLVPETAGIVIDACLGLLREAYRG